ncbi:MAG: RNA polymerase sigma factor [Thermoanaerobaculia bacterium]
MSPLALAAPRTAALADEEVVERVLAGETELFEVLMRRYNQRLYRVARGFVTDAAEAEDVAQEAYVSAFRKLGSFRGEARFSTWLTRIAVYEAMARCRKGERFVRLDESGTFETPAATAGPEAEAENHELQGFLREAVDSLPDSLRPVFVLREVEGLSSEETAAALGLSPANVRVRLHRAKGHLRQQLDESMGREACRLYRFDGARCDRLVAAVFARIGDS